MSACGVCRRGCARDLLYRFPDGQDRRLRPDGLPEPCRSGGGLWGRDVIGVRLLCGRRRTRYRVRRKRQGQCVVAGLCAVAQEQGQTPDSAGAGLRPGTAPGSSCGCVFPAGYRVALRRGQPLCAVMKKPPRGAEAFCRCQGKGRGIAARVTGAGYARRQAVPCCHGPEPACRPEAGNASRPASDRVARANAPLSGRHAGRAVKRRQVRSR